MAGDIGLDPFYKLVFPTMDMLTKEHQDLLNNACDAGDPKEIKATVEVIREALNPHPAGQKTLNAPKKAELTGVQHKYAVTVLFFAAATRTSVLRKRTRTVSSTTWKNMKRCRTSSSRAA